MAFLRHPKLHTSDFQLQMPREEPKTSISMWIFSIGSSNSHPLSPPSCENTVQTSHLFGIKICSCSTNRPPKKLYPSVLISSTTDLKKISTSFNPINPSKKEKITPPQKKNTRHPHHLHHTIPPPKPNINQFSQLSAWPTNQPTNRTLNAARSIGSNEAMTPTKRTARPKASGEKRLSQKEKRRSNPKKSWKTHGCLAGKPSHEWRCIHECISY